MIIQVEVKEVDIAIIGGGSTGLLMSSYLSFHQQVTLYVKRSEQKQAIEEHQVHVLKHSVFHQKAQVETKLMDELHTQHQLYIVCVKQTHINDVLPYLKQVKGSILFLQNGMGHIDKIKQLSQSLFIGVISHGANRTKDYEVNFLGVGLIQLAALNGEVQEVKRLATYLHAPDFPISYVESWEVLLQDKLIVNAVINPLTALFDVTNGEIIHNRHIATLAKALSNETASVLNMSKEIAWKKVTKTAKATQDNISSMRADINHRKETELEAITGYILQKSHQALPYTSFIYYAILALQLKGENQL